MKKIFYLLFVAMLFSCTTTKKYGDLIRYVNENKASELFYLIDNTTPARMKRIINRQDASGRTLLHTAVLLESPEIVEKLLSAGADKTIPDNSKKTAVDYAESSRNEKIRLLFGFPKEQPVNPQVAEPKKLAETQIVKPEKPLDISGNKPGQKIEPLNKKVEKSQNHAQAITVTQDVYSYNVILGVPDSEFLKAVKNQDYDAVNKLLKSGENVNEKDINGNNALFYALATGNNAIINLLLSYGVNTNYKNIHGQLSLLYAVDRGDISIIKALLAAGANINQKDTAGINAVMIAVFRHDADLLKFLHINGAYLTGGDSFGNTLLHIAIKNEDIAIVKYLLENDCDVYAPNDKGVKPLTLLKNAKRIEFQNMAKNYE